jgi:hypothetical protein
MPPFSIRSFARKQVTVKSYIRLKARFFVLGGVPRYLFDEQNTRACKMVEEAFSNTNWEMLKKVAESKGASAAQEISHRLLHRMNIAGGINGEYSQYEPRFASKFVAVMAAQTYAAERRKSIIEFLDETSLIGYAGTLRGNVFEPVAHQCIKRGGRFIGKELLTDGTCTPLTFTWSKRTSEIVSDSSRKLGQHDSYKTGGGKYFEPLAKNFECLDSWIVINGETWGLQFTVGSTHKFSSAIYWYFEKLNCKHYVTVVYDQRKYDSFKYSPVTKSKKQPFCDFPKPENFSMRQYVMKLELVGEDLNDIVRTEGYETFVTGVDDVVRMELGLNEEA